MRSADDYCESYILDKNFLDNVWRRNRNLIPQWWADALVWNRGVL
jgi:Rad3-related DNA helicase